MQVPTQFTLTLPSGRGKVLARRPSLFNLVAADAFPAELLQFVMRMSRPSTDVEQLVDAAEDLKRYTRAIAELVPHTLVEPRVGHVTALELCDDGRLTGTWSLVDIPDIDQQHLYYFAIGGVLSDEEKEKARAQASAAALEAFRDGPAGDGAGPDSGAVRTEALVDAGPAA